MIARRTDWLARMNDALAAAENRAFDWNGWDCIHFTADVVLAMTDVDILDGWRGEYATEAEAWALLAARDGSFRAALKRVVGAGAVHVSKARRGDIVLLRGGKSVGVAVGRGRAAFVSDDGAGLVYRQMSDCGFVFPIGWPE